MPISKKPHFPAAHQDFQRILAERTAQALFGCVLEIPRQVEHGTPMMQLPIAVGKETIQNMFKIYI